MKKIASQIAVSWMAMASVSAMAQSASTAPGAGQAQVQGDDGGIVDIVVTAQRRSENLSNVPIAVSAFSGETLAAAHIKDVNDVASRTPNFTQTSGSEGDPHLFIRGIGSSDDSAAGDRSVGVFVDDVYVGRGGAMIGDFFDVARVEVLRGPQGTLYGRNVVGGSINITTARPEFSWRYGAETSVGNYNLFEGKAFINVPFGDTTALRVSGSHTEHSGYSYNIFTGHYVDAANVDSLRGALRFNPDENLDIILRANYSNSDDFGGARKPDPCGPVNCQQRFNNPTLGNIAFDPNPRHVQSQRDGYFSRDLWGTSANINWTTGVGVISSITAYLNNKWQWLDEIGGLPDVLRAQSTNYVTENADQFSQELRLSSLPGSERLSWSVGAYYFVENIDRDEATDRCISSTGLTACATSATYIDYSQQVKSQSVAGYAELTYKPITDLSITVGARYTHDHKDATLAGLNLGGPISPTNSRQPWAPFSVSKSWNAFTPRAVVQYNFRPGAMAYATVSRGYKAGGYQGQADNGLSASVPYDPERVTNYEIGSKMSFLNRRVQLNVAGFYMKYNNLQVRQRVQLNPNDASTIINVVSNAANATIKGLEGELTVRPVKALEIWASGSLLDATYDKFVSGSNDYSGQYLPRSPKQSFSVGGELTIPLNSLGKFSIRGEAQYKGDIYFDNDNSIVAGIEPANTLVDASARLSLDRLPIDVQLWVKNLTNRVVRENTILIGDSGFSRYNAPRTLGLTIRIHD